MRILAIDYGEKRLGLAVSDPSGTIARGLPTLLRTEPAADVEKITRLIHREQVAEIIVGLPLMMDGTAGEMARAAAAFADSLRSRLRVPVALWDERLTTKAADRSMREMGLTFGKRKKRVDMVAAQVLLQGYLDHIRQAKEKPDDAAN